MQYKLIDIKAFVNPKIDFLKQRLLFEVDVGDCTFNYCLIDKITNKEVSWYINLRYSPGNKSLIVYLFYPRLREYYSMKGLSASLFYLCVFNAAKTCNLSPRAIITISPIADNSRAFFKSLKRFDFSDVSAYPKTLAGFLPQLSIDTSFFNTRSSSPGFLRDLHDFRHL